MVKSIVVTLTTDIPDTELLKEAVITIETRNYKGTVAAIIIHLAQQTSSKLTIEAIGLKTSTP